MKKYYVIEKKDGKDFKIFSVPASDEVKEYFGEVGFYWKLWARKKIKLKELEKYYNMKKFNNFMLFLIFFTIFMIFLVNKKGEMPPLLKTYKIWGKIF